MELKKLTLKEVLIRSNKLYAAQKSLSWIDEQPMRFNQFYQQVCEIQKALSEQGVGYGDKVALLSENQPNWGIVYFAVTAMGAVIVPILPDFKDHEVHHILRHSESKAIFVSQKQFPKIEEFDIDLLNLRILLDDFSIIPPETTIGKLKQVINRKAQPFMELKGKALEMTGFRASEVQEDDIACIIYTSGTTGHSKGVVLTHKNIVSNAVGMADFYQVDSDDIYVSILPLSHTYECTTGLVLAIMHGATVYYLRKPPTARVLLPAMQKVKPTIMVSVPLIMEKIYKSKIKPALTSNAFNRTLFKIPPIRKILHRIAGKKLYKSFGGKLNFFGIGGALLSDEVEQFLLDAKFPYAIGYGLTETSPLIAGCGAFRTKLRSTGWASPGVKIRIADADPTTGEGQIEVQGPNVMVGYFKDNEKTRAVFTDDGWFRTGDLGIFDRQNYLYIKGRSKNVIIGASGENVYPEEIEDKINKNSLVEESIVYEANGKITARINLNYDLIDQRYGGKKHSDERLRKVIEKLLVEIRKEVNSQISANAKIMHVIEQTEPFEKTPTKKIKRYIYTK
ncbi:MAG: AMP-binding protein [Candidatus Cloacimonadales bacterium]